jgi:hypothetical protein
VAGETACKKKGETKMLNNFKNRFLTSAVLLVASLATSVTASAQDYLRSFTVYNRSSLVIRQLFVAPSSSTRWGHDWLGSSVLKPNWWAKVNVEPGYYDIKLIDEGGRACVVNNVDFEHNDYISLNNVNLLACEFSTR